MTKKTKRRGKTTTVRYKRFMPADLPKEHEAEFLHFMSVFAKTWRTKDGRDPSDTMLTVVAAGAAKWAECMQQIVDCAKQNIVVKPKPHELIADADRRLRGVTFMLTVPKFMVKE
jgi:hypothetical protein